MSTAMSDLRTVPLAAITFSTTPAQKERRAHFDKGELTELAESIKAAGILQPILLRPFRDEHVKGNAFECVAGERRVLAARQAGLEDIPASVRELTDEQVVELQLIENLQRADLHELAEAEGYEHLVKRGHSAEDIAVRVGKSKAYVYARMKLLALGPAARDAFYRGELSASTALLLARIPVASVQREACGKVCRSGWGGPMSYRDARDFIEREYMLRLADAPFPTGDAELLKNVGACGTCPKRTGNQPELFADVKGADVCTDPTCFKAKREAWAKQQIATAKETGQRVISGAEAKKIAPHGYLPHQYARLTDTCYDDPKHRTFKQVMGKDFKPELLQMPGGDGELIAIVPRSAATKKLKEDGVIKPVPRSSSSTSGSVPSKAEREQEERLQALLFAEVHKRAQKSLPREVLEQLIEHEIDMIGMPPDFLVKAYGDSPVSFGAAGLSKMSVAELNQLLWEIVTVGDPIGTAASVTECLAATAKSLKIDVKTIRAKAKELAGEGKDPKRAAAASAEGKAAGRSPRKAKGR